MGKLAVGKKVADFSLDGTGGEWALKDAAGTAVVLYFYPRDNTSGCTEEGSNFAALHPQFNRANSIVLGISPDTLASHQKFKQKMEFPFDLLSDVDQRVCKLFDVIQEKSMYGRKYLGVERSTFLIGKDGVLVQEWRKVRVKGHAEALLTAVKSL